MEFGRHGSDNEDQNIDYAKVKFQVHHSTSASPNKETNSPEATSLHVQIPLDIINDDSQFLAQPLQ